MDVVICGAGEVGRHSAEVLAPAGHNITVIDMDADKLALIEDVLDVRSLVGNCAMAETQRLAEVHKADLLIAATHNDEVNLLTCSVGKAIGCAKTIARVHHRSYYERRGLDYSKHLGIDHLVCPEYTTAQAIAAVLRSPGAIAVQNFGRGLIDMQRLVVSKDAKSVGKPLSELSLPATALIVAVERDGKAFMPGADTVLAPGDVATVIGESKQFDKARKIFDTSAGGRQRLMLLGGTSQAVWLARELRRRDLSVRLFEADEERAIDLAKKLEWVTVLNADVINTDVLQEERVDQADAFVSVTHDDEVNILAAARAKAMGVKMAIAVLQRPTYLHLLEHIGIDYAFSPRATAVAEIQRRLDGSAVRHLATLSQGIAEVYEIRVPEGAAAVVNKPLRQIEFPSHSRVVAIQRGSDVFIPRADSTIEGGDMIVAVAPATARRELRKVFSGKMGLT
jgi:trk system potassium uptake protein TrkA